MRLCALTLVTWLSLGTARPAAADVFNELHGIRSLAMGGAHRGLGGSNDSLILNPAAMMLSRRYGVDVLYGWGGADERLNHMHLSAVDSKSGPVAGGLAYTHDWGNPSGSNASLNRIYLGSAFAIGSSVALGLTGQTIRGTYTITGQTENHDAYNATAGLAINLAETLGFGVVYQNIFSTSFDALMPPTLAFGTSLRVGLLSVAADLVLDMRDVADTRQSYNIGAEYFIFNSIGLRAGWRLAPGEPDNLGTDRSYIAGGVEAVTSAGAMGVSGEKTLNGPTDWRVLGGFQLFF